MALTTLHELLIDDIQDLYNAEKQLTKALPKMVKAAASPRLKQAFTDHLAQTREHVTRLEQVCDELRCKAAGKKCKAMEGLVKEGGEIIGEDGDPAVKDAALIGAAQRVEHYEIAAYGTAHAFAESLGLGSVARLLKLTRDEEEQADALLTQIAVNEVNPSAKAVRADDSYDSDSDDETDDIDDSELAESVVMARDRNSQ